jgi:hypothetical protein
MNEYDIARIILQSDTKEEYDEIIKKNECKNPEFEGIKKED